MAEWNTAIHTAGSLYLLLFFRERLMKFIPVFKPHFRRAIGRQFPSLPNYTRISIGTMAEMKKAVPAFEKVLAASAATSQHH